MLNLLRKSYKIWCQTVWLWRIDVACNRYNKYKQKADRRRFVVEQLGKAYEETYNKPELGNEVAV